MVSLSLSPLGTKVQRLFVYPERGFWGLLKKNVTLSSGQQLRISAIDLSFVVRTCRND